MESSSHNQFSGSQINNQSKFLGDNLLSQHQMIESLRIENQPSHLVQSVDSQQDQYMDNKSVQFVNETISFKSKQSGSQRTGRPQSAKPSGPQGFQYTKSKEIYASAESDLQIGGNGLQNKLVELGSKAINAQSQITNINLGNQESKSNSRHPKGAKNSIIYEREEDQEENDGISPFKKEKRHSAIFQVDEGLDARSELKSQRSGDQRRSGFINTHVENNQEFYESSNNQRLLSDQKSQQNQIRYGIVSSYECRKDHDKKHPKNRPFSATIMAIQHDVHPRHITDEMIQTSAQAHEWREIIQQSLDADKASRLNRVWSSKQLRQMHQDQRVRSEDSQDSIEIDDRAENKNAKWMKSVLPEEFLKQVFFNNQNQGDKLGSQCPKIVKSQSNILSPSDSQTNFHSSTFSQAKVTHNGKLKQKPRIEYTSLLYKPKLSAANSKKSVRTSQSLTSVKYYSKAFEYFDQQLAIPAKQKIEFYKLHKQLHDCKVDEQRMKKEEQQKLEERMPIYSKEDIVQIKNGNLQTVLQFNALTRPQSASSRVLAKQTDPLNNLMRKFYRNSNKPLGNTHSQVDLFSKRPLTTIEELNGELQNQGLVSREDNDRGAFFEGSHNKMQAKTKTHRIDPRNFKIGDPENSMLRSELDVDEDKDQVIMELDDDEEAVIIVQASPSKQMQQTSIPKSAKEFEMLNSAPSFMDSNQDINLAPRNQVESYDTNSTEPINLNLKINQERLNTQIKKMNNRPFSALIQNSINPSKLCNPSQGVLSAANLQNLKNPQADGLEQYAIPESESDSEIGVKQIVNIKALKSMNRPMTSKIQAFKRVASASKSKIQRLSSSQTRMTTQMSTQSYLKNNMMLHSASHQTLSINEEANQNAESIKEKNNLMLLNVQNLMIQTANYPTMLLSLGNLNHLQLMTSPSISNLYQTQQLSQSKAEELQKIYEHKALKNRDVRINSNFNYQYAKNKQLIKAQQVVNETGQTNPYLRYQRLLGSQSTKRLQSTQSESNLQDLFISPSNYQSSTSLQQAPPQLFLAQPLSVSNIASQNLQFLSPTLSTLSTIQTIGQTPIVANHNLNTEASDSKNFITKLSSKVDKNKNEEIKDQKNSEIREGVSPNQETPGSNPLENQDLVKSIQAQTNTIGIGMGDSRVQYRPLQPNQYLTYNSHMQKLATNESQAEAKEPAQIQKEGVETIFSQSHVSTASKKFVRPMTAANRIRLKQHMSGDSQATTNQNLHRPTLSSYQQDIASDAQTSYQQQQSERNEVKENEQRRMGSDLTDLEKSRGGITSQQITPLEVQQLKAQTNEQDAQVQLSTLRTYANIQNNPSFLEGTQQSPSIPFYFSKIGPDKNHQNRFPSHQQPKVSVKLHQKNKASLQNHITSHQSNMADSQKYQSIKNKQKSYQRTRILSAKSQSQKRLGNCEDKSPNNAGKQELIPEDPLNNENPTLKVITEQNYQSQPEIIYPLRAPARIRPISAAINKNINQGYYNTIDIKFGATSQLQNQRNQTKNSKQRAQLLQFIGQDYQGLQRNSRFAVPDAIIQRQAISSNPLAKSGPLASHELSESQIQRMAIQDIQNPSDQVIPNFQNEMLLRGRSSEADINKQGTEEFQNSQKLFHTPSVATLNCYIKPGSPTKMLMIGPQIN